MSGPTLAVIAFAAFVIGIMAVLFASARASQRKADEVRLRLRGLAEASFEKGLLRSIHAPCASAFQFTIRAEDARTERMRQSGELVEQQTGDATFDRNMYIECDDTRVGNWLRGDAEARKLIASLVGPQRTLVLRDRRLALNAYDLQTAGGDIRTHATHLRSLADRVPGSASADPVTAPQRASLRMVRAISFVVLGVGLAAGCYVFADWIMHPAFPQHVSLTPLLLGAALVGSALATPAYSFTLRAVRGTSHAPRLASELFVSIWIPIVATTMIAAQQYNLKAIEGDEHAEETQVTNAYSTRGNRSTSYYLVLPALDDGRIPSARYASTSSINASLHTGQRVRVYWRKGALVSFILTRTPEPLSDDRPAPSR